VQKIFYFAHNFSICAQSVKKSKKRLAALPDYFTFAPENKDLSACFLFVLVLLRIITHYLFNI